MKYETKDKKHVLLEDFKYGDLTIPKGFKWDGASIPAFARRWIGNPRDKQFAKASLIHDYLYTTHKKSRFQADLAFAIELIEAGVPHGKVKVMLFTVIFLGFFAWNT